MLAGLLYLGTSRGISTKALLSLEHSAAHRYFGPLFTNWIAVSSSLSSFLSRVQKHLSFIVDTKVTFSYTRLHYEDSGHMIMTNNLGFIMGKERFS